MSWFFACWLWWKNIFLDQHCTLYLWLLNANLLQLSSLLVEPLAEAKISLWNWVIWSLGFSECWHGSRNLYQVVCDRARFFGKNFLPQKVEEMGQKFHWICSIMKINIICSVLAQMLCLEKKCSWEIGQNALSQSDSWSKMGLVNLVSEL